MSAVDDSAERPRPRRRSLFRVGRLLKGRSYKETIIACLAALLSFFFLMIVIMFMSFIEYQSRLLKSQSSLPTTDVVNSMVATYELDDVKEKYEIATAEFEVKSRDVEGLAADGAFRIDRICSMFCVQPSSQSRAQTDVDHCRFFLSKIPFAGTATPPLIEARSTRAGTSGGHSLLDVAKDRNRLAEALVSNFTKAMGGATAAARLDGYGPELRRDLLRIADGNLRAQVELLPEIERLRRRAFEQCQRAEIIAASTSQIYPMSAVCPTDWRIVQTRREVANPAAAHSTCEMATQSVPARPAKATQTSSGEASRAAADNRLATLDTAGDAAGTSDGTDNQPNRGGSTEPGPDDKPRLDPAYSADSSSKQLTFGGGEGSIPASLPQAQLRSELLTHFRLFQDISFGWARTLILSPPDYLAQWLLVFGGALGAMLKILFLHLMPKRSVKWSDLVLEPAQGMVCAIIVFILFRSGFVVISGQKETLEAATLSPYFVAFIAIGSGLLSEQALQTFRNAATALFGKVEWRQDERWAIGLAEALDSPKPKIVDLAELADRIGVTPATVKAWADLTDRVSPEKQREIVVALGLDEADLFTDLEPKKRRPPPDAAGQEAVRE